MKFEDMLNTITLGDSYKLIKDIPDKSIDLVIIDPPYNFHCGTINKTGIFKNRECAPGKEIVNKKNKQRIQIRYPAGYC